MSPKKPRILLDYKGWRFYEVSPKLAKEIDRRSKAIESGKVKAVRWMGSIDKTIAAEQKKTKSWTFSNLPAKEAAEVRKKAKAMRSGKAKSIPLQDVIQKLEKLR